MTLVHSAPPERNDYPAWAAEISPRYRQPAYFSAIDVATSSGTEDGARIAATMKALLGIWDSSATLALCELADRAYEAGTESPFGRLRNTLAIARGIDVIELYGPSMLRPHFEIAGIDMDRDLAGFAPPAHTRERHIGPADAVFIGFVFGDMRNALVERLQALLTEYASRDFSALADLVEAAIEDVAGSQDPAFVGKVAVELARAIEETCITAACHLADGLFQIGDAFHALADGIANGADRKWFMGARDFGVAGAHQMADNMREEMPPDDDGGGAAAVQTKAETEEAAKSEKPKVKTVAEHIVDTAAPILDKWRADNFTMGEPPVRKFTLHPHFPAGVVGLLFGAGGAGKSMQAMKLCLDVATRDRSAAGNLNFQPSILGGNIPAEAAGAALFVTGEDDEDEIKRRMAAVDPDGRRKGAPLCILPLVDEPEIDPTLVFKERDSRGLTIWAKSLDLVMADVPNRYGVPLKLLVLDPAGDLVGGDENDSEIVKFLMLHLRRLAKRHNCSIILIGHTGKGQDQAALVSMGMRGSSAWVANSRAAVGLWEASQSEAKTIRKKVGATAGDVVFGRCIKANHPEARKGLMTFVRDADGSLRDVTALLDSGTDEPAMINALVQAVGEAAEAGEPLYASGKAGLHYRRSSLPEIIRDMGRDALQRLAATTIELGRLAKGPDGALIVTDPGA